MKRIASMLAAALKSAHSKEEYAQQAMLHGRQFMQAINGEFSKVQILCLFGPSLSYDQHRAGKTGYDLLAPFVEGMCSAADEGTKISDGYEQSYMYRYATSFKVARQSILDTKSIFQDPSVFDRVMRVGFGLWTDNGSNSQPWNTKDFDANYFQPNTYQAAVYNALDQSDQYVWVYCERLSWLIGENVPDEYRQAQIDGRKERGKLPLERKNPTPEQAKWIKKADERQNPHLFDDLMKSNDLLIDLKDSKWQFQIDPDDKGPNGNWTPIDIEKFWEEQGWDYDGYGWYQTTFRVNALDAKRTITLAIGAADESCDVWLNDQKVGSNDIGENGWDQRVTIDISKAIKEGDNTLRIRVLDRAGPGGLWRPVRIFQSK